MAAKKKKMWFGFLEAGSKGSPVVRETALETGDPKTIYLFNFMKGRILEYRRDIVEIKLRELAPEELAMIPQLRKAYKEARESFEPRPTKIKQAASRPKPAPPADDFPEFDGDDAPDFDVDLPLLSDSGDDGVAADIFD
jgi:hypothetical protein